jgi:hypothetical protein
MTRGSEGGAAGGGGAPGGAAARGGAAPASPLAAASAPQLCPICNKEMNREDDDLRARTRRARAHSLPPMP